MEKKQDDMVFGVDTERFKSLGVIDPKSHTALKAFNEKDFTSVERLYFKLLGTDLVNAGYFAKGQKIAIAGEHVKSANVIISGQVEAKNSSNMFIFGPGSVFGMAEGLSDEVYQWDVSAITAVTTKVIPIDRASREIIRLNAGLKGICRSTIMRILKLKQPPKSLL